jgi:ribosomal protein S18 acetylase RimI-like enzyme
MDELLYKNIDSILQFFFSSLAKETYKQDGIKAWYSGINHKGINIAYAANMDHPVLSKNVKEVIEFFRKFDAPWTWVVTPFTQQSNLEKVLESHSLKLLDTAYTMVHKLENLNLRTLQNYHIKEVTDIEGMTDWALCLNEAFGTEEKNDMDYRDVNIKIPYGGKHAFHHFVGYLDDEPIAAGTLSVSKYGTRIDNIGTKTDYLRKGFGSMITLHLMHEAKRLGYKFCCLDASSEGLQMYKKLGFIECYESKIYG